MTQQPHEQAGDAPDTPGIDDAGLPEDLRPGDDNPLAEPLEPGETPEVDLNQPSGTYERELAERGDDGGSTDQADDGQSGDGPSRDARRATGDPRSDLA